MVSDYLSEVDAPKDHHAKPVKEIKPETDDKKDKDGYV